jgi:hypothetical protein
MFLLEPQHLPNFPITQRRLPLLHFSRDRRVGTVLFQELPCRECCGDGIVGGIEHLESQSILLHTQITYLTQVPCIDITPSIALAHLWIVDVLWEIVLVLVGLDNIADAEGIDISIESTSETPGDTLAAEFGYGVRVHWVYVKGFVEGEGSVVEVTLAEADFVCGFAGGNDDLLNAEFASGFDDIVGAGYVSTIAFIVLEDVNMGLVENVLGKRTGTSMFRA